MLKFAAVILLALPALAQAQTLYKCDAGGGKMVYQDRPCYTAGKESKVDRTNAPLSQSER